MFHLGSFLLGRGGGREQHHKNKIPPPPPISRGNPTKILFTFGVFAALPIEHFSKQGSTPTAETDPKRSQGPKSSSLEWDGGGVCRDGGVVRVKDNHYPSVFRSGKLTRSSLNGGLKQVSHLEFVKEFPRFGRLISAKVG